MRCERLNLCVAAVSLLACVGGAGAQAPDGPGRALPPPPMPMAGRVFPVYPLYPAYGAVPIAYAGETFVAADVTGYFLYAAPANYWSVPTQSWRSVPHPQAAEIVARFTDRVVSGEPVSPYDEGFAAYWRGEYAAARDLLDSVTRQSPHDARAWTYLALARRALGQDDAAREAARRGAAAAIVYPEENAGYLAALERVQGPARRWLTAATADVTAQEAEAIMSRLPKPTPK